MFNNLIDEVQKLPAYAANIILVAIAILSGLLFKGIVTLLLKIYSKNARNSSLFRLILSKLNRPLTYFLPLFVINLVLPLMEMTTKQLQVFEKVHSILLIITFSFVLIALVKISEEVVYRAFDLNNTDNLKERKIRTQLQFIRKIIISLIVILAIGAVLLSFSSLRRIGTGLLTGVGVGGIIVGFAAQRSLGNLLAGLQIAFTQPLRIDDVLVVEGEWGRVEEITLTYVVLNIWDQRRLILPINYFIEKPFQNWTRTTSEILATVFIYLDYNAPFDLLRNEFNNLLETSELWDRRVGVMQVTDATADTVELRLLLSASNSGRAFDLKCFIRESMIEFIQKNCPESLPKTRIENITKNHLFDSSIVKQ